MTAKRTLKASNTGWLTSLVAVDVAIMLGFVLPEHLGAGRELSSLSVVRAATLTFAPVIIMLLAALLPSNVKASLVFWRLRHALPGHRAFSIHAVNDPRIDIAVLQKNAGKFQIQELCFEN